MTILDLQMQMWRSGVDIWTQAVDTQIALTRQMLEVSTRWMRYAADTAEETTAAAGAVAARKPAEETVDTPNPAAPTGRGRKAASPLPQ